MVPTTPDPGQVFNNPDSFAQVFDATWMELCRQPDWADADLARRVELVLERLGDHPFLRQNPDMARQVAHFRVRLLRL
jgi:hypothetical protein